jgi:hypothetical protein
MKKIKVIKLGTRCKDIATKLEGTLTHWTINMSGYIQYIFQPLGLDEEGQPVTSLYFDPVRLKVEESDFEEVEVPLEILGTKVTHEASGFTGMAITFIRHINGCFHVYIQPEGVQKKNKKPIEKNDFDLRSCSGQMIAKMSEEDLKKSKTDQPSPTKVHLDDKPGSKSHNV